MKKELVEITMPGLHRQILEILQKEKKVFKSHLDIGCGSGAFLEKAKKFSKKRYGCDINAERFSKSIKIHFKKADLNGKFPFSEKFDLITAIEVIEHVENQFKFLRDVADHLAINGQLIISTPNNSSIFNKLYFLITGNLIHFNRRNMLATGHINPVFEETLLHNVKKYGLRLIDKKYSNGHLPILNLSLPLKTQTVGNVIIFIFKKKKGM